MVLEHVSFNRCVLMSSQTYHSLHTYIFFLSRFYCKSQSIYHRGVLSSPNVSAIGFSTVYQTLHSYISHYLISSISLNISHLTRNFNSVIWSIILCPYIWSVLALFSKIELSFSDGKI